MIPVSHVKARALRLGSLRLHSGTPSAFEGSGPPAESAEHLETFAGSACGTNAAFEVSSVKVTSANNKQGSMKESLMLQINEEGLDLPANEYVRTLNIIAYVSETP